VNITVACDMPITKLVVYNYKCTSYHYYEAYLYTVPDQIVWGLLIAALHTSLHSIWIWIWYRKLEHSKSCI